MDRAKKKALMYKMRKYRENLSKDDKERIKANDRARKAREAAEMTEEEKAERREKDRERKARKRAEKFDMSDEVEAMERELDRRRKADERTREREQKGLVKNAHLTGYLKNERERNCQYKIKMRKGRSQEQVEYDKIKDLIRKREVRISRTKEEQNKDKEKAKEGMRQGRYYGYLGDEMKRSKSKFKSIDRLWRCFWDSSDAAKELLKKKEIEIAEKLEEEDRNDPELADKLAAEDKTQEEEIKKLNSERIKAWRKKRRMDLLKALNEPIIMPEVEKSEYEKIRDENVRQLEEARKEIFDSL